MDNETLSQLAGILQRVTVTFKALDDNVIETTASSATISESVEGLTCLVEELNVMLHEAISPEKNSVKLA